MALIASKIILFVYRVKHAIERVAIIVFFAIRVVVHVHSLLSLFIPLEKLHVFASVMLLRSFCLILWLRI